MDATTTMILYFAFFVVVIYFLLIRPQQKQQKKRQEMLKSLRVRDKVTTAGGILGKIVKVKDETVIIQIADKVEIEVLKAGVSTVENRETSGSGEEPGKKGREKPEPKEEARNSEAEEPEQDSQV